MTTMKLNVARLGKKHIAVLLASSALMTVGCSTMETTATGGSPFSDAAKMSGKVHGGNNAVSYAGVQLMIVGQSGVGSAPTILAQTTTGNDGTGSFQFTKNPGNVSTLPTNPGSSYQCPTGADPLLYIYAAGGNTTGNPTISANNTAAAFLAPVGYCSQVTNATFVDVSEVTTAATVAAAAQFINPNTDGIGDDGIGVAYQAIGNAFKTIPNLVSAATGQAQTTTTIAGSGTGVSGVTITVTSPAATVNTIANILSSCVNQVSPTSASNCSTLFANAVPPPSASRQSQPNINYPPAADTVEAALYMFLYPSNGSAANRTNLFNLSAASGAPFQPVLASAPNYWLLPITYSTTNTCGSGGSSFFSHPYGLSIDINGNLWIANKAGSNGALVEMTPSGLAETCVTLGGSSTGVVVDSGYGGASGSIWYVDAANNLIWAYPTNGGSNRSFASPAPPIAIAADGNGNIFFTTESGGLGSVYEILNAANPNNFSSPILITSQTVGPNPASIFPDAAGDIWVSSDAGYVTELQLTANTPNVNGYQATQYPVISPAYGLTVGLGNKVYVASQDANSTFSILAPTNNGYASSVIATGNVGGLSNPTGISLDGAQNSWIANDSAESSGLYAVSVIGPTGSAVTMNGTNGGDQLAAPYLNASRSTVVDPVGNIWILNDSNPNSITLVVGGAVPIYAPYAAGLANGRFQSIP